MHDAQSRAVMITVRVMKVSRALPSRRLSWVSVLRALSGSQGVPRADLSRASGGLGSFFLPGRCISSSTSFFRLSLLSVRPLLHEPPRMFFCTVKCTSRSSSRWSSQPPPPLSSWGMQLANLSEHLTLTRVSVCFASKLSLRSESNSTCSFDLMHACLCDLKYAASLTLLLMNKENIHHSSMNIQVSLKIAK